MKFYNPSLFLIMVFFILNFGSVFAEIVPIDAKKNAVFHNNQGINYLREGDSYAAIASFKIALGINPASEASATIYNNLGNAYLEVGHFALAEECYEAAIKFAPMSFSYYQNLVKSYKKQNLLQKKLFDNKKVYNNMNDVVDGLILLELGEVHSGCYLLKKFAETEPDLIISCAIKEFLENLPDYLK